MNVEARTQTHIHLNSINALNNQAGTQVNARTGEEGKPKSTEGKLQRRIEEEKAEPARGGGEGG